MQPEAVLGFMFFGVVIGYAVKASIEYWKK